MADTNKVEGTDAKPREDGDGDNKVRAEKRQSTEGTEDVSAPKKFSMSLGSKPAVNLNQKISFNLGGSTKPKVIPPAGDKTNVAKAQVLPIKMSLGTVQQKAKEPPPVVQKSALAAKVFDDDDDSDDEEMPPEAKMRMKNIGRNTPTASGPNSYGKGKHGFSDRQKILEKQLKEEMDRVSGDRVSGKK